MLDHFDWAEDLLSHFSWGQSFLEINGTLFEKYAACTGAEEVKEAEMLWLDNLEKEYQAKRAPGTEKSEEVDDWVLGNVNHMQNLQIDEDDKDEDSNEEDDAVINEEDVEYDKFGNTIVKSTLQISGRNNLELKESIEDDRHEMERIRQKVLQAQTFQNPLPNPPGTSDKRKVIANQIFGNSDNSEEDESEINGIDDIYNALLAEQQVTKMTKNTSKSSKGWSEGRETVSAVFSSSVLSAPSNLR